MKKIIIMLFAAFLLIGLVACSSDVKAKVSTSENDYIAEVKVTPYKYGNADYEYTFFEGSYYLKSTDDNRGYSIKDGKYYNSYYVLYSDKACTKPVYFGEGSKYGFCLCIDHTSSSNTDYYWMDSVEFGKDSIKGKCEMSSCGSLSNVKVFLDITKAPVEDLRGVHFNNGDYFRFFDEKEGEISVTFVSDADLVCKYNI